MNKQITSITFPKININEKNPFNEDIFERKAFSIKLTQVIDRFKEGGVIAVDAQWGEGKTWFGKNWKNNISSDHKTIYIDVFESDYIEDPFIIFSSEILNLLETNSLPYKKLGKSIKEVGAAILPTATNIFINLAGSAIGVPLESEVIKEGVKSAAEQSSKWVENKIKNFKKEKESIINFKNQLSKYCEEQEKPVVIFIDELDRCNPHFSVKVLERIKHFFDVDNLVFVLLINGKQLETAIKGVYGEHTDAATYLRKFITLSFRLPKIVDLNDRNTNRIFIRHALRKYGYTDNPAIREFESEFYTYSTIFNLSLRDIEKAIVLLSMTESPELTFCYAWLITLKLVNEDIFIGLTNNSMSAFKNSLSLLNEIENKNDDYFSGHSILVPCHKLIIGTPITDDEKNSVGGFGIRNHTINNPLSIAIRKMESIANL